MLGTPLSDAAYAALRADYYTKSRLAVDIPVSSVPPRVTENKGPSPSSDDTASRASPSSLVPQRPQAVSNSGQKTTVHAVTDRVSISTQARVAVQHHLPQPTDRAAVATADSDRAREVVEPASERATEREHSSSSAGVSPPGQTRSHDRKVDTYA